MRFIPQAFAVAGELRLPPLVPRFRRSSMQTCHPLRPRAFVSRFQSSEDNVAFVTLGLTRHGQYPTIRFKWGLCFGAFTVRICYGLSACSPSWRIIRGLSPHTKTFTPMLEYETVTRLDYGYDYIGVWTPPMAGLSRKKSD